MSRTESTSRRKTVSAPPEFNSSPVSRNDQRARRWPYRRGSSVPVGLTLRFNRRCHDREPIKCLRNSIHDHYTKENSTMKCPVCTGVDLKIADRQGVEIDYCPECRGVWLDRGELDKIIERSYPQAEQYQQAEQYPQGHRQQHRERHHDDHGYGSHGYHRKKSWLSELFD